MGQVSVSSIIDRSGSMSAYNYLEPAKTDAATFVTIMHASDQIGLVAIDSSSPVLYNLKTLDTGGSTINSATSTIAGIQAQGITNMKAAITNAHSMLGSAANAKKAIILLSDGEWNTGGDPLTNLPTDIPIYTIALGSSSGITTLQSIASNTGGKYYYSPDAFDLASIYNQITTDSSVAQTSLNKRQQIPSYNFTSFPLQVPSGVSHVSLGVNWLNSAIDYTAGTPGKNQVSVLLRDPNGDKIDTPPTFEGGEYVTFHLHDPMAGEWKVGCWCGDVPNNQFMGTMGGFEPDSTTTLQLSADSYLTKIGKAFLPKTVLNMGGKEVSHVVAQAYIDSPVFTRAELVKCHAKELDKLKFSELKDDKPANEEDTKLRMLHQKRLPQENIFARKMIPHECKANAGSKGPELKMAPVTFDKAGDHTIHLEVKGQLASCGSRFTRIQRMSVHVEN